MRSLRNFRDLRKIGMISQQTDLRELGERVHIKRCVMAADFFVFLSLVESGL